MKRIPDIIIEPQKQQTKKKRITQNPLKITMSMIIYKSIITKNKHKKT